MARTKKTNKIDFTDEQIKSAAQGCYYSMGIDKRYLNLVWIFETLVLPEDCTGYTIEDMAKFIKEKLNGDKGSTVEEA